MKDYTSKIIQKNDEDGIFIKFVLLKSGSSKLNLVRSIKLFTGLGLKQSKDFVDESSNSPVMFYNRTSLKDLKDFRDNLATTDSEFILDDLEKIRNKKLIDLGLGEKNDIIGEIVNQNIFSVFLGGFSSEKLSGLLYSIYSYLDENKLLEIYESNRKEEHDQIS